MIKLTTDKGNMRAGVKVMDDMHLELRFLKNYFSIVSSDVEISFRIKYADLGINVHQENGIVTITKI